MYHLPSVLIDYIFSFDDNAYYKRKIYMVIKELDFWYGWKRTQIFLDSKYNTYEIYYDYQSQKQNPTMNVSQYILWGSKTYSQCIYVNNMKWKLQHRILVGCK